MLGGVLATAVEEGRPEGTLIDVVLLAPGVAAPEVVVTTGEGGEALDRRTASALVPQADATAATIATPQMAIPDLAS